MRMKIEMASPNDGKFYEDANFETGENCVLVSRAEVDRRRVEFAMMYEALEAAERRIQADIDNWEYTMSSEDLQYNIEGGRDTLAKIKAALGRSK